MEEEVYDEVVGLLVEVGLVTVLYLLLEYLSLSLSVSRE